MPDTIEQFIDDAHSKIAQLACTADEQMAWATQTQEDHSGKLVVFTWTEALRQLI